MLSFLALSLESINQWFRRWLHLENDYMLSSHQQLTSQVLKVNNEYIRQKTKFIQDELTRLASANELVISLETINYGYP